MQSSVVSVVLCCTDKIVSFFVKFTHAECGPEVAAGSGTDKREPVQDNIINRNKI